MIFSRYFRGSLGTFGAALYVRKSLDWSYVCILGPFQAISLGKRITILPWQGWWSYIALLRDLGLNLSVPAHVLISSSISIINPYILLKNSFSMILFRLCPCLPKIHTDHIANWSVLYADNRQKTPRCKQVKAQWIMDLSTRTEETKRKEI